MAGGRKSKVPVIQAPLRTLVLDNGASTLKAGFVTEAGAEEPRVVPNCLARDRQRKTYVASDLEKCKDFGEVVFRRPIDKGFIVNWETQKEIWDHEFFNANAPQPVDPSETRLVLAERPNALPALQTNCDQMVFEEFQFASYYRGVGSAFNAYLDVQPIFKSGDTNRISQLPSEILLLIDSGYSCTTITPILRGRPLQSAIKRLDVGGKLLTNYLTKLLSVRHYDMRNDTYIVNEMKETACYVSLDFKGDLEKTWKGTRGQRREAFATGGGIAKDYVLPDFHTRAKGVVRDYDPATSTRAKKMAASASHEDVLTLRNERFVVPEVLFNPPDIGLRQAGIASLVMQSLSCLPVGLWPGLLANIVVVGGNALFEGFVERLQKEIVQLVPDDCIVRVARPDDPITCTWRGAAGFAQHQHATKLSVTKQEYDENGAHWVARKFSLGLGEEALVE